MIRITIDDEDVPRQKIDQVLAMPDQLRHIHNLLGGLLDIEQQQGVDLDALIAKVEAETSIDESIKVLIEGLGEDPALATLADRLKASREPLVAAIKANVP